jgi:phage shock protein A
MTVFSKIRLITLGNVHDLLDKVIDANSSSAIRQHVRDLETALSELQNTAAVAAGQVRTLNREKGDLEAKKQHVDGVIKQLLQSDNPSKETFAKQQAVQGQALKQQIDAMAQSLVEQTQTSKNLDEAVAALDRSHTQWVSRLRTLEVLDRGTKAKEQAADVLKSAGSTASAGVDLSADDIESRMRARGDVADEKFSRAMDSVSAADPANSGEADDYLASIKATMQQPAGVSQ